MSIISVVICAHNEEKYIERCIRSVLNQNFDHDYEVIVVDDFSEDNTSKILENFKDQISVIRNSTNLGIGATSNIGIRSSKSRYVVRVDADDYVSEYFLQVLYLGLLNKEGYSASSCNYHLIDEFETFLKEVDSKVHPIACAVLYKKDALVELGLYSDMHRVGEDEELRVRFNVKYRTNHIPISLYRYRIHEKNTTNPKKILNRNG